MHTQGARMKKVILFFTLIIVIFSTQTILAQDHVAKGIITSSEISSGSKGVITVTFTIPQGMHQSLQEDYFYIEAEEVEGIEFLHIQYPEGVDHEGIIEYYDSVTLTMNFIVADDATVGEYTIKIYAGYQYCDNAGMCHFPEEEELALSLVISGEPSVGSTKKLPQLI